MTYIDEIYECPNCKNHIGTSNLISYNNFKNRLFSDFKSDIFESPNLTRCKKCKEILLLRNQKLVGGEIFDMIRDLCENKPEQIEKIIPDRASFVSIENHFRAIESNVIENKDDEIFIRMRILWRFNDKFRYSKTISFIDHFQEKQWEDNIRRLIELLDFSDEQNKVMIAELNRNLGNFDESLKILEAITDKDYFWMKEKLINECNNNNKCVIEF